MSLEQTCRPTGKRKQLPRLTALNGLLIAQRLGVGFPLPRIVRGPFRRVLTKWIRRAEGQREIEDWSTPLISGTNALSGKVGLRHADSLTESGSRIYGHGPGFTVSKPAAAVPGKTSSGSKCAAKLRCLLVTSSLDVGGMEEVVVFLARRLPQYGIRTAVLHASQYGSPDGVPTGRLGKFLVSQGIEAVELDRTAGVRWLETLRPDVISAHDPPSWVLETAVSLSIPYVDTLHGMHSLFDRAQEAEATRGQKLSMIVAVSELQRQQYLYLNPFFPPDRIITIPNAVDDWRRIYLDREAARAKWGIDDEYVFLSLARYCLIKNTYGLVAAFEDVASRNPRAHLVIVGRPDDHVYFSQIAQLRTRLACRDRIHLRDHYASPAELLALADGFVLNSFSEGWSLASMEALYAGVPVVLSEVGGAREQVGCNGERGYVVPNPLGDPFRVNWTTIRDIRYERQANRNMLIEAMNSLIANRAQWLAKRPHLIRESARRFHPDVCLRSHAQVLQTAVGEAAAVSITPIS